MALKMILGPAGTGKTDYCLNRIAQALTAEPMGRPQVLIVPEQATFIYERKLAERCPGGGFSGAEVASFQRLCLKAAQSKAEKSSESYSRTWKGLRVRDMFLLGVEMRSLPPGLRTRHISWIRNLS